LPAYLSSCSKKDATPPSACLEPQAITLIAGAKTPTAPGNYSMTIEVQQKVDGLLYVGSYYVGTINAANSYKTTISFGKNATALMFSYCEGKKEKTVQL
jgi:hypothetical protein